MREWALSEKTGELHVQGTYDKVASTYDDLWTKHVAEPNARLTRAMKLRSGEKLADLACGTGVYTLDMARLVAPAESIAVDYSQGMLDAAQKRAEEAGLHLSLVHAKAEDFIRDAAPESLDAVSVRFVLAYLDWRKVLPQMGRPLRRGGRLGLLTSLSNAVPQLWTVWKQLMDGFGEEVHFPAPVPDSNAQMAELLAQGGLETTEEFEFNIRLWFDSGAQGVTWLRESGYGTHPALQNLAPEALESLAQLVGASLEQFREEKGVPLDIICGGVIAVKR